MTAGDCLESSQPYALFFRSSRPLRDRLTTVHPRLVSRFVPSRAFEANVFLALSYRRGEKVRRSRRRQGGEGYSRPASPYDHHWDEDGLRGRPLEVSSFSLCCYSLFPPAFTCLSHYVFYGLLAGRIE